MRAVPNIDSDSIKEHIISYEKYLELSEDKK